MGKQSKNCECERLLLEVVTEACWSPNVILHSYRMSSYADALRHLSKRGYVELIENDEDLVVARLKDDNLE